MVSEDWRYIQPYGIYFQYIFQVTQNFLHGGSIYTRTRHFLSVFTKFGNALVFPAYSTRTDNYSQLSVLTQLDTSSTKSTIPLGRHGSTTGMPYISQLVLALSEDLTPRRIIAF